MDDKELNLVDHLEELRKRIIVSALAFVVFFIAGFIYVDDIYKWFVGNTKLMVLGPSDIMWIYFMLATVVAVAGTIPVLALQIWLFVRPALRPIERRITISYVPALFFLFIIGLAFGYFIIFPMVLDFLVNMGKDMFVTNFTAERYFSFIMNMTLPFGVLFELPVVVMFLTSLGIINPFVLAKIRKYAYFVLIIIAIVITPPDFMSDFVVTLPLLLLYEISINLSKFVYRKRLKKLQEEDKEDEVVEA
ncbi:twin-arginine translocase subunit TatC [Neobacillus sp. C211]|jgi:sec-independent protein translocase protein TatC|uniref:Sec-independent protein translocase protein TatC n=1 Tax=Priestia megaterium TaxID=1404 RepID=A0A6H1P7R6_PRIMG|nr:MULTISPECIES: twin-arginine translocase subunit TatC [Bacillaceae]MBT2699310.1 twin-arginine translocase subunit TatC [Bacillus sp. ISL-40]MBT2723422.1 twin-arginine translocase subunit TatC [Bacillus sp. ISL-46]MBT2726867.1 twin-arginine translocase subunit TatC [Bacillus sp. ISL-75]MBT2737065.1 twin-arginine translocase subunit TatC [Bacillus sp. ISL-7]MBT2739830.1 twin-arginine translocase subunit TatC [Bacillus sp. ISL-77]